MAIMFPDGSLRRPDIAVYCTLPDPTQEAARKFPEAVIEIVSPSSEVSLQRESRFY